MISFRRKKQLKVALSRLAYEGRLGVASAITGIPEYKLFDLTRSNDLRILSDDAWMKLEMSSE